MNNKLRAHLSLMVHVATVLLLIRNLLRLRYKSQEIWHTHLV